MVGTTSATVKVLEWFATLDKAKRNTWLLGSVIFFAAAQRRPKCDKFEVTSTTKIEWYIITVTLKKVSHKRVVSAKNEFPLKKGQSIPERPCISTLPKKGQFPLSRLKTARTW